MSARLSEIEALPVEILTYILTLLPTRELLSPTLVSRCFHSVILRILHLRILEASQLKGYKLILECYHPSNQNTSPYLFCEHLRTPSLDSIPPSDAVILQTIEDGTIGGLGALCDLYTHFRPIKPNSRHGPRPHPAGGSFAPLPTTNALIDDDVIFVRQNIDLEPHEFFTQLCVISNLVKVGPKRGLFLSNLSISEGTMRVFRKWLIGQISLQIEHSKTGTERKPQAEVLWADAAKTVGLRLSVVRWTFAGMDNKTEEYDCKDDSLGMTCVVQYDGIVQTFSHSIIEKEM